jgi:anti-sigma factor RsiW
MKHLSTTEIFEIVDDTIANGARTKLMIHLEECAKCRQEVEFHRKLERSAKAAPLARPSRDFTARVLSRISPRTQQSWSSKIIDNLGSILAMGLVLTVVWYANTNPALSSSSNQITVFSQLAKTYVEYYSRAHDFLAQEKVRLVGEPSKEHGPSTDNAVTFTIVSILILAAFDRYVVRRVIKTRI